MGSNSLETKGQRKRDTVGKNREDREEIKEGKGTHMEEERRGKKSEASSFLVKSLTF